MGFQNSYSFVAICDSNGPIHIQAGRPLAYMTRWQLLLLPCWLLLAAAMGDEVGADFEVLPHRCHVELCRASVDEDTYEWHAKHLITKEYIPLGRGAFTIYSACTDATHQALSSICYVARFVALQFAAST
jgi:hypothetical protein